MGTGGARDSGVEVEAVRRARRAAIRRCLADLAFGENISLQSLSVVKSQDSQKRSPSPADPSDSRFPPNLPSSNRPHSQFGYSWSSFATGGSLFFRKANPFNGVPALSDDFGAGAEVVFGVGSSEFAGDGVKGVEKGWAVEVDVAAGGDSGWR